MAMVLLIISGLLVLGAVTVLAVTLMPLAAELRACSLAWRESVGRIRRDVAGIRHDESRVRENVSLLAASAAAWERAVVLPREAEVLTGNIRVLGMATALLSACRRSPWKGVQRLVAGR